jgi:hypothetical protein
VPKGNIHRAIERKKRYEPDPERHKAEFEVPEKPEDH